MMHIRRTLRALAAMLAVSSFMGCAGARSQVVMPDSRYPVSMSNGIYGPEGQVLLADDVEVVGEFLIEETAWAMLYSAIPFTPELDVSEELNKLIEDKGGEGVVRLRTEVSPCALDYFVVFTFIPFWPGCALVEVRGDIIRRKAPTPAAPKPEEAASAEFKTRAW